MMMGYEGINILKLPAMRVVMSSGFSSLHQHARVKTNFIYLFLVW